MVIKRVIFSHWFLFSSLLLLFSRDSASFFFITFFPLLLRVWSLFTFLYIGCSCNSELLLSSSSGLFSLLLCFNSRISGIYKFFPFFSLLPHVHTFFVVLRQNLAVAYASLLIATLLPLSPECSIVVMSPQLGFIIFMLLLLVTYWSGVSFYSLNMFIIAGKSAYQVHLWASLEGSSVSCSLCEA